MLLSSITLVVILGVFLLLRKHKIFASNSANGSPKVLVVKEVSSKSGGITPDYDFDIHITPQRPYRPWSSGKFAMTMGIRKVPENDMFLLDKEYIVQQELRRQLLVESREGVMQCLPDAEEACVETLDFIVNYLTKRYPNLFVLVEKKPGYLHNRITDLTFKITAPFEVHPLEVAAQLVMEDLNIMIQGAGEDPEQHYLRASFSMAPAGWYLQERIGWPLWKIHTPVPMWEDKLRKSIERFFLHMKVSAPVQRNNFFLQVTPTIFQQDPFPDTIDTPPTIEDIIIRHERQTLQRLPKTKAILFTVRTFFTPVTELESEPESIRELVDSALAMPEEMARYKCRQVWFQTLQNWASIILDKETECQNIEVGKKDAESKEA
ncbi:hypothetical protein V491_05701 [Pseudogymnoascus sp. VKM F-3775]|nr:hypothetical protein V491_05701 [Pseudogymnoascus sp. VKM F-3775]